MLNKIINFLKEFLQNKCNSCGSKDNVLPCTSGSYFCVSCWRKR